MQLRREKKLQEAAAAEARAREEEEFESQLMQLDTISGTDNQSVQLSRKLASLQFKHASDILSTSNPSLTKKGLARNGDDSGESEDDTMAGYMGLIDS